MSFVKNRTVKAENKYKIYKNKLTAILRHCEKDYYNNLLKMYKNDIKGTWKILNSVIKKSNCNNMYPEEFVNNNQVINGDENIANGFNDFFVNIGPNLANNI